MEFFSTFGVDPLKLAFQSVLWLLPAGWATIRVVRSRSGVALPLWLILVWMLPLIGAVLALIIIRHPEKQNPSPAS